VIAAGAASCKDVVYRLVGQCGTTSLIYTSGPLTSVHGQRTAITASCLRVQGALSSFPHCSLLSQSCQQAGHCRRGPAALITTSQEVLGLVAMASGTVLSIQQAVLALEKSYRGLLASKLCAAWQLISGVGRCHHLKLPNSALPQLKAALLCFCRMHESGQTRLFCSD